MVFTLPSVRLDHGSSLRLSRSDVSTCRPLSSRREATRRAVFALLLGAVLAESTDAARAIAADSCGLVLVPHEGGAPEDVEIRRLQQRVASGTRFGVDLERLGWAYVAKARVARDPGYYTLARECALCLRQHEPESAAAVLLEGHVLHQLHRFVEAETLARDLVAKRGLWRDHALLGDILVDRGELDEGTAAYERMMHLRPGPEAYARAAHVRRLRGDLDGAIESMARAARAYRAGDRASSAWSHDQLARWLLEAGRLDLAEKVSAIALDAVADHPPALLTRGRIRWAKRMTDAALADFELAASRDPLPEHQWAFCDALRGSGEDARAAAVERSLVKRGAVEDPRTYSLYLSTRAVDAAEVEVGTGVGSLDVALRLAESELSARSDVYSLDALAWARCAGGDIAGARELAVRVREVGTADPRLLLHSAVIERRAGDAAAARRLFLRVVGHEACLFPSERRILEREQRELQIAAPARDVSEPGEGDPARIQAPVQ